MSQKNKVYTGTDWEKQFSYSRATKVGKHIFVAGTTAIDGREVVGIGDAYGQSKFVLEKIEKALDFLGANRSDVVRTRMFVTDIGLSNEVGKAHGEFFKGIDPVATMVEVSALIHPDMLVEIEVDAVVIKN
ncbi:MAG: RidA family protein [Bacteroidia bacterium]|nr:RidA family protein [Bacteroidia bacterium]